MMSKPTLLTCTCFVWEKSLCGQAARPAACIAQTENVCGHITARVKALPWLRIRWAREIFLVLILITPPRLKISHQKGLSHGHGYYRSRSTESRSLDMIGEISLVMWLHFNQSYSKNLSMWDIINTILLTNSCPFIMCMCVIKINTALRLPCYNNQLCTFRHWGAEVFAVSMYSGTSL